MATVRKTALSFKCGNFAQRYPDHEATDMLQEAEGLIADLDAEIEDLQGYRNAFFELAALLDLGAQTNTPKEVWEMQILPAVKSALDVVKTPVPMVLHCPRCHLQHIDAPDERTPGWQNPPHRSHRCHGCSLIWRPADVATVGVAHIQTAGKDDTPNALPKGYVLVPLVPTWEMRDAGGRVWSDDGSASSIYAAMLAQRPEEP